MTNYGFLHGTTDARVWADAFLEVDAEHNIHADRETMVGWFANAIQAGEDGFKRPQVLKEVQEFLDNLDEDEREDPTVTPPRTREPFPDEPNAGWPPQ